MDTHPSSISNTPHSEALGVTGRPLSEELFTYNLELALLSVLQKEDEYGRESIYKWRSEKELYQNAWSTPTHWDWTSSGSASSYVSEASTGISTPAEPCAEDVSFEPPRAWSMIRDRISSKVITSIKKTSRQLGDDLQPLKRKLDDESGEDEWLPPRKKVRTEYKCPPFAFSELTPPSSPPSHNRNLTKSPATKRNGPGLSPRGISYGEITPPDHDEKEFIDATSSHAKISIVPHAVSTT